jgi:hypothetical protein
VPVRVLEARYGIGPIPAGPRGTTTFVGGTVGERPLATNTNSAMGVPIALSVVAECAYQARATFHSRINQAARNRR